MEIKSKSVKMEDEREEGELTEEELEDVSDSSISIPSLESIIFNDNSILNREPFKELSLTSISDDSSDNVAIVGVTKIEPNFVSNKLSSRRNYQKYWKHKRCEHDYSTVKRIRYTKRRRSKTKNHEKRYSTVSSSSSETERSPDRKVVRQLRDAVRISSTKKSLNCSLHTRIKRMINPELPASKASDSEEEDEEDLEALRDQALKSKLVNQPKIVERPPQEGTDETDESMTDKDLINLRIIALQSAMQKKYGNRKKGKEVIEVKIESEVKDSEVLNNETCDNIELDSVQIVSQIINETIDKITNENKDEAKVEEELKTPIIPENKETNTEDTIQAEPQEKQKTNPDEDEDILRAMLLTSMTKKIANRNTKKSIINKTKVIPTTSSTETKKITTPITTAPTLPVKRLVINVNSDSESDTNVVTKKKKTEIKSTEKNNAFEQNLTNFLKEARIKSEMQQQSDISKHLPRSQQLEYRHLKRKLQQLSKLKLHAKLKKDGDENKQIRLNIATKKNSKFINNQENSSVGGKKLNNADRYNVKGKYEELTSLMMKVSQAKTVRDKAQTEVKKLINDLRNARIKLTTTHQTYTMLIQQLLQAKAELDERANILTCREKEKKKTITPSTLCTSTPNTTQNVQEKCEISGILPNNNTLVAVQEENDKTLVKTDTVDNVIKMDVINEIQTIELKADENEIEEVEMKIEDDKVDEIQPVDENEGIVKYKSPLDHIQNNSDGYAGNPLTVFCPYDLLGVCRDPDCTYRHQ